jgi:3-hydroxybutyryl-CoA dehydrogenase
MPQSKHIAVVGARFMGIGIAQLFAEKGHEVTLFDQSETILKAALRKIESNMASLSRNGGDLKKDFRPTVENIKLSANLQAAVEGARFVVETLEDKLKIKQALFKEMEAYCSPVTIFATHTSTFGISEIAAKMMRKKRVVGTRFWFPPYLVRLVEVMGNRHTLPEVKGYVCNLLHSVGMHPVLLDNEVPGFIGQRLLQAIRREALSIVEQGIATPDIVDEVVKAGLAVQLSVLGVNEKADENMALNGRFLAEPLRQLIDWNREKFPETSQKIGK